jgi:putative nucleotidyltransferase with HDIG domain
MFFFKKTSPRRTRVRKIKAGEKLSKLKFLMDADVVISILILAIFMVICVPLLSFQVNEKAGLDSGIMQQQHYPNIVTIGVIVFLICLAAAFYIGNYQRRIIGNHVRLVVLAVIFFLLLLTAKVGLLLSGQGYWVVGSAFAAAVALSISYAQRFALGMGLFYCILASFLGGDRVDVNMLLIMAAAVITCCFSLKEIRTRMKLLEVGALSASILFVTTLALSFLAGQDSTAVIFETAGSYAVVTFFIALLVQGLLPFIERYFHITTSMTLLDYSDANQPLLKRLAMEAPGTYSHSLLVGSIAEAAAEAIGRNGLLCRVGSCYHDIGKINKPGYFVENELSSISRHKELSPAMSQLIIIGHVKDGIEMAKEYGLPVVLRQFIEAHHGTTLIEYFYNEAKKKTADKQSAPSEAEFRYAGPKPRTKEAAIVMLADAVESSVRSLADVSPGKIEAVVHNMAMKRLQDGQFDECDLSLQELSRIETSMSKTLAAHYHGRVAYPTSPDMPDEPEKKQS